MTGRSAVSYNRGIMKNIVLPVMCLLVGGVAGYGLRSMKDAAARASDNSADHAAKLEKEHRPADSPASSAVQAKTAAANGGAATIPPVGGTAAMSLGDRMKELLLDFDVKSAQKALSKLSASDLQAALALVTAMPKSSDRDALRAQLYRAWAAQNPTAAWKAALADPLDKSRGYCLGVIAAEVAKTNPQAGIDLALSLGMGARRSAVMNAVFTQWSRQDAAAALAYSNAHPDQPVDSYVFSSGISSLAEKDPLRAAGTAFQIKDPLSRTTALSALMSTWMVSDREAALKWALAVADPNQKREAVAACIGAWARNDPGAAIGYARTLEDVEVRDKSVQSAWRDWFRQSPSEAMTFLAGSGDDKLMENVAYNFISLTDTLAPKELGDLLSKVPEGKGKERILSNVIFSQLTKGQFNQALATLNGMSDSVERDRQVNKLGEEWAKSDLAAATAWLKLQPDSSDRDLAVAGYAATLARTDVDGALEWARTIPDEKVRVGAMKNIAVRWLKKDAAGAEAWMAGVGEFTETDRKFIRSMAAIRGDYLPASVRVGTRR